MKYSLKHTRNHPIITQFPICLIDIENLLVKDGCDVIPSPFYNTNTLIIDGDELEKNTAVLEDRKDKHNSTDVIFICSNGEKEQVQLVELKFNFKEEAKNPLRNLIKEELERKVKFTSMIFSNTTVVNRHYLIVFRKNLKQQARYKLQRFFPNRNYEAIDIDDLKISFF